MAVKVRLSEGVELVVDISLDAMTAALEHAIEAGEMVAITDPNGDDVVINPAHVLYISNGSTAHLSGQNGATQPRTRPEPVA